MIYELSILSAKKRHNCSRVQSALNVLHSTKICTYVKCDNNIYEELYFRFSSFTGIIEQIHAADYNAEHKPCATDFTANDYFTVPLPNYRGVTTVNTEAV